MPAPTPLPPLKDWDIEELEWFPLISSTSAKANPGSVSTCWSSLYSVEDWVPELYSLKLSVPPTWVAPLLLFEVLCKTFTVTLLGTLEYAVDRARVLLPLWSIPIPAKAALFFAFTVIVCPVVNEIFCPSSFVFPEDVLDIEDTEAPVACAISVKAASVNPAEASKSFVPPEVYISKPLISPEPSFFTFKGTYVEVESPPTSKTEPVPEGVKTWNLLLPVDTPIAKPLVLPINTSSAYTEPVWVTENLASAAVESPA